MVKQIILKFHLPVKTISVNHLYGHRGNRKYIKKEGRDLRKVIISTILRDIKGKEEEVCSIRGKKLFVQIQVGDKWLLQDGVSVRRKDLSNIEKFLIDSVFEALDIDDKFIWRLYMEKIVSDTQYINVLIVVDN